MKTTSLSTISKQELCCFECGQGRLQSVQEEYQTVVPTLGRVSIPDVPMLRCDHCGDMVIGDEGNKRIDQWLSKITNAITPGEITELLHRYGLTQKEASVITGLGEKNISRWISGRSRPSESVSNFLRLLLADQPAFERLRQRNFSYVSPPANSGTKREKTSRTKKPKAVA